MGVTFLHGEVDGVDVSPTQQADSSRGTTLRVDAVRVRTPSAQDGDGGTERVIGCGHLVNAAGAWSARLVDMCGGGVAPLPVAARRRSIFSVRAAPMAAEGNAGTPPVVPSQSTPLVVDPTGVYFRPEGPPGHFICGVSPPESRGDPDGGELHELDEVDHGLFDEIVWPTLYARCEAFGALKVQSAWSGFYEYNTLDQNAIIGNHPHVPNLILCNGFSGHGLQQAPGAGRAVAELLTTGSYTTVDVSCFGFDRVLSNEPIFEKNIV
jgi:glycine/D-amino acid oxidase-like deaminating enzyme